MGCGRDTVGPRVSKRRSLESGPTCLLSPKSNYLLLTAFVVVTGDILVITAFILGVVGDWALYGVLLLRGNSSMK
jgi:hypothetical protein